MSHLAPSKRHEGIYCQSLGEIFAKDNTLADIADMPPGYIAERSDVHDGWQIKKRG